MQTTQTLTPLAQQLERVDKKLPVHKRYAQNQAQLLLQLLVTPVSALFGQDQEGLEGYWAMQSHASRLLRGRPAPSPDKRCDGAFAATYQGQLELIYHLMEESGWAWSRLDRDDRVTAAADLLTALAQTLSATPTPPCRASPSEAKRPQSLQARLDSVNQYPPGKTLKELVGGAPPQMRSQVILDLSRRREFPVLAIPLSHYFCAATLLQGNGIPLATGRRNFEQPLGFNRSLVFAIMLLLNELPFAISGEGVDFKALYQLLVEPIFPIKNHRKD